MEILVVDDSETVRIRLKTFLEESGYTVSEANSGVMALEVLTKKKEIDLIITDLNMPEMDGLQLIEEARKLEKFIYTPIIVCTTEVTDSYKERARELGVRAWIKKPLDLSKMLAVLKRVLTGP